jgi:hypothetical protein
LIKYIDSTSRADNFKEAAVAEITVMSDTLQNAFDLLDDQQKKKWIELSGEPLEMSGEKNRGP